MADPRDAWNVGVIERLELRGDERVLDAGCGSGRGTEMLVEALPRGRAIGVDGSPSMVAAARELLGDTADIVESDLQELAIDQPVDAIVSTATLHWVPDHARTFQRFADALVPGGKLETDCGGFGNVAKAVDACDRVATRPEFADTFAEWERPWHFETPDDTVPRLEAAGFDVRDCWLTPRPTAISEPREYMRVVIAAPYLDVLPVELHDEFVDLAVDFLDGATEIDYVRLNIGAVKRGA
ncbi:MAG: methyltransferase domain-containing protein [Solirubrobacterales bacterium]